MREPLFVKLGPKISPPRRPDSVIWSIEVQRPSILRCIMMTTNGVQKLLKTDCEDLARLSEMLPSAFPEMEAKVTEIATGDWEEDFGINFLYHNNASH